MTCLTSAAVQASGNEVVRELGEQGIEELRSE